VLAQTFEDFELLVVGDGCTDRTAEVVRGFDDARLRWFDLPKAPDFGYANRNVALREAAGELVAFMAHDDLWLPDHLELLARRLDESGAEIAYSLPLWVIPRGMVAPLVFNLHHTDTLSRFVKREQNGIPAGCVVHRRECLDRYGYWDASLPRWGDLDMWARIIEGGGRDNFTYLPEPTCLHFRANWRTGADAGPPGLQVWEALHALDGFMPDGLKVDVPDGVTEQEAFWGKIEENPRGWTTELRAAAHAAVERRVRLSDEMILSLLGAGGAERPGAREMFEAYARTGRFGLPSVELAEGSLAGKLLRRTHRVLNTLAPPRTLRGRSWLRVKELLRRTL
jgi:glycosyltransferase involved in cell wall biosynthesis